LRYTGLKNEVYMANITELFRSALEGLTGAIKEITTDHAYIHEKKAFIIAGQTTIANGGTYKINFKTPNPDNPAIAKTDRLYCHWRPALISGASGGVSAIVYEDSTGITPGTVVSPLNLNRNDPPLANTTANIGATVTGNGTPIQYLTVGVAGNPAQGSGGSDSASNERVLKTNTDHTVVFTNLYAGNNLVTYELFFYEEENGASI